MRRSRMERRLRRRNANATVMTTVTEYERPRVPSAVRCRWRIPDPAELLDRVVIVKKPDPNLWKRVHIVLNPFYFMAWLQFRPTGPRLFVVLI